MQNICGCLYSTCTVFLWLEHLHGALLGTSHRTWLQMIFCTINKWKWKCGSMRTPGTMSICKTCEWVVIHEPFPFVTGISQPLHYEWSEQKYGDDDVWCVIEASCHQIQVKKKPGHFRILVELNRPVPHFKRTANKATDLLHITTNRCADERVSSSFRHKTLADRVVLSIVVASQLKNNFIFTHPRRINTHLLSREFWHKGRHSHANIPRPILLANVYRPLNAFTRIMIITCMCAVYSVV